MYVTIDLIKVTFFFYFKVAKYNYSMLAQQNQLMMPIFLEKKLAEGYNCAICKEVATIPRLVCINIVSSTYLFKLINIFDLGS